MPDWIRTEVYHALSVHFPIAFLFLATVIKLVSLFLKRNLHFTGSLLLYVGVITAWVAIYTGDLADGAVARSLCDPTVLKDHEQSAYSLAYIFTAAALFDLTLYQKYFSPFRKPALGIIVVLMLIGTWFLIYTGDLGASLVYQQAAGVSVPSENCEEFE